MSTILITGGHKGLGLEAIRLIAATRRFDLLLAGRNMIEIEAVVDDLGARHGVRARAVLLDLSSLVSVREAVEAVRRLLANGELAPLGALMLNAGAQFDGKSQHSVDGHELTFATNCLGHFLLLNSLLDHLADDGRVIFTASGTHDPETMDGRMVGKAVRPDAFALAFDGREGAGLSRGVRYATSKLCTVLYAYELHRRLRANGSAIRSIAYDPGMIPETALIRWAPAPARWALRTAPVKWLLKAMGVTMGDLEISSAGLAGLATGDAFADAAGVYIQSRNGALVEARSSAASHDEGLATRLWSDSETLAGLRAQDRPRVLQPLQRGAPGGS